MPASPRGYHTLTEYRDCPRRFFLHRVCGIEPKQEKSHLIRGRLIHEFQEKVFDFQKSHTEFDSDQLLEEIHYELEQERNSFYAEEDYIKAKGEILGSCFQWYKTFYEQDKRNLIPINSEWLLKTQLSSGYDITGRLDRVYWSIEDEEFAIYDTKTSRWGAYSVEKAFSLDDQATVYERLLRTAGPIQVEGVGEKDPQTSTIAVIPDIIDLKKKTPTCLRTICIRKNNAHWNQFDAGACKTLRDIQESLECFSASKSEIEAFFAFPCHASTCSKFGCEYSEICHTSGISPNSEALPEFTKVTPNVDMFFQKTIDISDSSLYIEEEGAIDV